MNISKFSLLRTTGRISVLLALSALCWSNVSHAERLRDLASIQGVRANQLVGYGLAVGLDGSGDQTTQTPFTVQSVVSMLQQLGVNLPSTTTSNMQLKNVAAVMVTTSLPAFAQPGQTLDVTVSSIGNAKSLRGGTLLMAPLKGADGQIYAIAQGNVVASKSCGEAPIALSALTTSASEAPPLSNITLPGSLLIDIWAF